MVELTPARLSRLAARLKVSAPADFDWSAWDSAAQWDSTLSFHENCTAIESKLGFKLKTSGEKEEELALVKAHSKWMDARAFEAQQRSVQAHFEAQFAQAQALASDGNRLLDALVAFNPHCEKWTFSTLMAINQGYHCLNVSPAGYGKSRSTCELLEALSVPHTRLAGHLAPSDLFRYLRDTRGILVVDESFSVLRNPESTNLLLSALWGSSVRWREEEATVQCTIIFNSNALVENPVTAALTDRCITTELALTEPQLKEKIRLKQAYEPDAQALGIVAKNVFVKPQLSDGENEFVLQLLLAGNVRSMRDEKKLFAAARTAKALFGDARFVSKFVAVDEVSLIARNTALPKRERVRLLMEKGVSERQSYRMLG